MTLGFLLGRMLIGANKAWFGSLDIEGQEQKGGGVEEKKKINKQDKVIRHFIPGYQSIFSHTPTSCFPRAALFHFVDPANVPCQSI